MELISLAIGIAGFLFGLFMYFKSRSPQEITIIYANRLLESKSGQGVEMLYLGEPVSQLVRYDITVFNSGRKEVRTGDFKSDLQLGFENLGVVSQTAEFDSPSVKSHYETRSEEIEIGFEYMKPNDHMTFEVLTGGLSGALTAPVCYSRLRSGGIVKVHNQVFDEASLCVGIVLFSIVFYSKYQAYFAGKELALREQLAMLLKIESLTWFALLVVSLILLLFAYESAKAIAPKFRLYKFEQLIQNRE